MEDSKINPNVRMLFKSFLSLETALDECPISKCEYSGERAVWKCCPRHEELVVEIKRLEAQAESIWCSNKAQVRVLSVPWWEKLGIPYDPEKPHNIEVYAENLN